MQFLSYLTIRRKAYGFSRSNYNRVIIIAHRNIPISRAQERYIISNIMLLTLILITFEHLTRIH